MIQIKDKVVSDEVLLAAQMYIDQAQWSYGWPSNKDMPYGHWNVDFTKTPKHNPTDVSDRLPEPISAVWEVVKEVFFKGQAKLVRAYANRHTYGTEGYIHTDTNREEDHTCVIYMDNDWDVNWGGETVFYNLGLTEIVQSVIPHTNRAVVFPGNIPHCAKGVSRICPKVRTTLMFKVTIDPKAVYDSEEMLTKFLGEAGADKVPHKIGSLADHLIRTYHVLKMVGAGDILALAGGLHSIYGTNAFKRKMLRKDSTAVRETFGPEVDRLVRLFSGLDRPTCLETPDGTLDDLDLFLLRTIECANLYDQNELTAEKYPKLYEFAVRHYKI